MGNSVNRNLKGDVLFGLVGGVLGSIVYTTVDSALDWPFWAELSATVVICAVIGGILGVYFRPKVQT